MVHRLLLAWVLTAAVLAAQDRPPNILFIFSDDHGSQAISAYGSQLIQTPNIDRLAREGARFDRTLCTNGICAPSRAVVLTGRYSHLNGVTTNAESFDGSQVTFPKLLQQAGYQTAMIGKWHLKSEPTGFDHWEVLRGQGPYYNPNFLTPEGLQKHEGYTTDIITDRALAWLEKGRDASRPFLLMYQHKAPHRHWQPAPRHLRLFDDVTIPEPDTLFDDWAGKGPAAKMQEMTVAHHLFPNDLKLVPQHGLTDHQAAMWNAAYGPKNAAFEAAKLEGRARTRWMYQRYAKDYLRCVTALDENIGRVLDWLDATGLADNTVVIYSSDQGWYLGEHGWYDKRWMYEESLRMPLVVRWPGVVRPGTVVPALTSNLDFAPTFLDLAGVVVPNPMQGQSLVPWLRGERPSNWRKSHYYHYYEYPGAHAVRRHYGVRTERYKLIRFYGIGAVELYDLETDPDEVENLAGRPEMVEVERELERELERLRRLYAVPEDTRPIPTDPALGGR